MPSVLQLWISSIFSILIFHASLLLTWIYPVKAPFSRVCVVSPVLYSYLMLNCYHIFQFHVWSLGKWKHDTAVALLRGWFCIWYNSIYQSISWAICKIHWNVCSNSSVSSKVSPRFLNDLTCRMVINMMTRHYQYHIWSTSLTQTCSSGLNIC